MKNILLPTDFSENSWNAIAYAMRFYEDSCCHFYLLHVNRTSSASATPAIYGVTTDTVNTNYTKISKEQLKTLLNRINKEFKKNKLHKFFLVSDTGSLIESIRNQVRNKKIEMTVMGTKGASGFKKLLIGSNTGDVITKVKCTTLIIPENAKFQNLEEVAFPTDYSLHYEINYLEPLTEILEDFNSNLRILHINKKDGQLSSSQQVNKEYLDDYFIQQSHTFHHLTNNKVEEAIQCFVESRNINMIAMMAKNLNYFQQILFHTKIQNITYHTDIPFLVLHDN